MMSLLKPLRYAFALAVLWAVLAWYSPSTTYHLAPLLVAGVVPGALLLSDERSPWRITLAAGAVGASLALITTTGLGLAERLIGPSLLPSGGAVVEAVVFAALGATAGVVAAAVAAVRAA